MSVSLHPVIDPARCLASSSCVSACPVDAITRVFGTEKRGIDIPTVTPEFESNVPGLFIAGELGGMGLIRKAAEQGRQAIAVIRKRARGSHDFDVVIVGCGPAGLSAGLSAIEHKVRYKLLEQDCRAAGPCSITHATRSR